MKTVKSFVSIDGMLTAQATQAPHRVLFRTESATLTYQETDEKVNELAAGLARQGVRKGTPVLIMIGGGLDGILLWLATTRLGAIYVPINDSYIGSVLRHQIVNSGAEIMIVDADIVARFYDLLEKGVTFKRLIIRGNPAGNQRATPPDCLISNYEDLFAGIQPFDRALNQPWDPSAIFYTSGTTGPSKGVLYGHGQAVSSGLPFAQLLSANDVLYYFSPIYHVAVPVLVGSAIRAGACVAIRPRFSMKTFWSDIVLFKATVTLMLGSVADFICKQPERPEDAETTLRLALMVPVVKDVQTFRSRFRCEIFTWFNMTEVNTPITSDGCLQDYTASCGRPRPGIEVRVADEKDYALPNGRVGELLIRSTDPWELNLGYWKNPQKTVESWRNQWFHTGDLFRMDDVGNLYYVDRIKDAIRRRGENISSFDIETEIGAHASVAEFAAVAVPADESEDEILAVVTVKEGCRLTELELHTFLCQRLPRFMVPRYIRIEGVPLPRTDTGKTQKSSLRSISTKLCWDAMASKVDANRMSS